MLTKPYPKDNEARTMALPADLVGQIADGIGDLAAGVVVPGAVTHCDLLAVGVAFSGTAGGVRASGALAGEPVVAGRGTGVVRAHRNGTAPWGLSPRRSACGLRRSTGRGFSAISSPRKRPVLIAVSTISRCCTATDSSPSPTFRDTHLGRIGH